MFNAINSKADLKAVYEKIMTVITFSIKLDFPFQKIYAKIGCFCMIFKLIHIKISKFVFMAWFYSFNSLSLE